MSENIIEFEFENSEPENKPEIELNTLSNIDENNMQKYELTQFINNPSDSESEYGISVSEMETLLPTTYPIIQEDPCWQFTNHIIDHVKFCMIVSLSVIYEICYAESPLNTSIDLHEF